MIRLKEMAEVLRQYFEKQSPVNYGGADTILDALFWLYIEHNSLDCDVVKAQFAKLREYLKLPPQEYDEVFYIVSDLCILHSRSAFTEGIRLGFQLRNELV